MKRCGAAAGSVFDPDMAIHRAGQPTHDGQTQPRARFIDRRSGQADELPENGLTIGVGDASTGVAHQDLHGLALAGVALLSPHGGWRRWRLTGILLVLAGLNQFNFVFHQGDEGALTQTAVATVLRLLLGLLTAAGPFTTDTYLPSMPAIREHFAVDMAAVQLTLSLAFFGGFFLAHPGRAAVPVVGAVVFCMAATWFGLVGLVLARPACRAGLPSRAA